MERELQEIAAVIECTDRQFLPRADTRAHGQGRRTGDIPDAPHGPETDLEGPVEASVLSDPADKDGPMAKASWFDERAEHPTLHERVEKLESFTAAMADGVVDKKELEGQEQRLDRGDEGARAQAER